MIAGLMHIRLMAKQRKLVYNNQDHIENVTAAKEARDILPRDSMTETAPKKGDGYADLSGRYGRGLCKHGEVNYYITLFLTDMGSSLPIFTRSVR